MNIASRTPEGWPNRCPLCGKGLSLEPSPTRDATCPHCGHLVWFAGPDRKLIEETRKQISRLIEEIARLSERNLPPAVYFEGLVQRVQQALAGEAVAAWTSGQDGGLRLQAWVETRPTGIDASDTNRRRHAGLLRHIVTTGEPQIVQPRSGVEGSESDTGAGNPTIHVLLLVPVVIDGQVQAVIEAFQNAARNPQAFRGYLQFLVIVADLAARYLRNQKRPTG